MPNYSDLELEYNNRLMPLLSSFFSTNTNNDQNFINMKVSEIQQKCINGIRMKYLQKLSSYTGRNVIVYYSTWLHGANLNNPNPELMINDNDMNGLMNAVYNLDKTKGLDLIIHTPGGGITATEAIVNYLRKSFKDIRVIVPHMAMSAGTMIACAANKIVMGKQSSLGPVDPQYRNVPAEGVIDEFERAIKETCAEPQKSLIWKEIISQYRPTFIGECQNAVELSKNLVKSWLKTRMFSKHKNKDEIVHNIMEELTSHRDSKMHDKHYDCIECKNMGLKILEMETDQILQDSILAVHHSYVLSSYIIPTSIKYIENNNNQSFIISGKK